MSRESIPITASIFADAIKELPLSAVYAKVSELRNSISHLHRSNDELRSFITSSCESEDDKRELESYVSENEGVVASMEERIGLLKAEVENRGHLWTAIENATEARADGSQATSTVNGTSRNATGSSAHNASGGPTNDDQGDANERDEGVHL